MSIIESGKHMNSIIHFKTIEDHATQFLTKVFRQFESNHFALASHWHIDHLCYRTSTPEQYAYFKYEFSNFSNLLIESEVNGRMISTFKLHSPIKFNDWKIELLELPAPKKNKTFIDGFEHLEVVCDCPFDEIKKALSQLQIDESGLIKDFNQELEIVFDGFAVKFHHLSLESVINLESNRQVYNAIRNSDVLSFLKPFNPLIAGTFPLNLYLDSSDVDILITANNFDLVSRILDEKLKHFPSYKRRESIVDDEKALVVTFVFDGVNFEIFGQHIPSIKQRGYRHFLAEERLLKIGGMDFRDEITKLRRKGLKTEPAFATLLGLEGDPYEELLILQKKSNRELQSLFNREVTNAKK